MKVSIKMYYVETVKVVSADTYETEETAQDVFDMQTIHWHEWDDPNRQDENPYMYGIDLIVHHPDGNDYTRRSMYSN